jgi:hypothetical protein
MTHFQPHRRRRADIYLAAALADSWPTASAGVGLASMVELVDEWERAERVGYLKRLDTGILSKRCERGLAV